MTSHCPSLSRCAVGAQPGCSLGEEWEPSQQWLPTIPGEVPEDPWDSCTATHLSTLCDTLTPWLRKQESRGRLEGRFLPGLWKSPACVS